MSEIVSFDISYKDTYYVDSKSIRIVGERKVLYGSTSFAVRDIKIPISELLPLKDMEGMAYIFTRDYEWLKNDNDMYLSFFNFCIENELYLFLHYLENNNKIT